MKKCAHACRQQMVKEILFPFYKFLRSQIFLGSFVPQQFFQDLQLPTALIRWTSRDLIQHKHRTPRPYNNVSSQAFTSRVRVFSEISTTFARKTLATNMTCQPWGKSPFTTVEMKRYQYTNSMIRQSFDIMEIQINNISYISTLVRFSIEFYKHELSFNLRLLG